MTETRSNLGRWIRPAAQHRAPVYSVHRLRSGSPRVIVKSCMRTVTTRVVASSVLVRRNSTLGTDSKGSNESKRIFIFIVVVIVACMTLRVAHAFPTRIRMGNNNSRVSLVDTGLYLLYTYCVKCMHAYMHVLSRVAVTLSSCSEF